MFSDEKMDQIAKLISARPIKPGVTTINPEQVRAELSWAACLGCEEPVAFVWNTGNRARLSARGLVSMATAELAWFLANWSPPALTHYPSRCMSCGVSWPGSSSYYHYDLHPFPAADLPEDALEQDLPPVYETGTGTPYIVKYSRNAPTMTTEVEPEPPRRHMIKVEDLRHHCIGDSCLICRGVLPPWRPLRERGKP
jgi:hypothetical protein